ncbi:MAG: undecaprenyldiphospho-muramoylpentapeptide beta-N-acetylglucosaminyltransferase [Bacteroidota bacterium]|jgi:UDP-N-acetylglucosamine--N-acetylmuramyl-(pentapeptide) pyrophosphoryl-undecaprenol N-acetylglucosamine transferase
MKIIISGGGTGGHIFPAVAVADELKRRNPDCEILFVGAQGKMEMERVPKAGYKIEGLPIQGLQRKISFQNILKNLQLLYKLPLSLWKMRRILTQFQPDVVVGFGGFASAPTMRAAAKRGIPTVLQEQNSYAGVTNKLSAQRAAAICVAYENMSRFFPSEKILETGNPVRQEVWQRSEKTAALSHFGLSDKKKTIFVVGGSLGAKTLNWAIEKNADWLKNREDVQVLWQCGRLYEAEFAALTAAKLPNVKLLTFVDRMDLAYSAADVVISRAGALSISELCLVGVPTILVPSPNVSEDHQTKNAMALVEKNAAVLVRDVHASEEMLQKAGEILDNPTLQQSLRQQILTLGKPNAARDIAQVVEKTANLSS